MTRPAPILLAVAALLASCTPREAVGVMFGDQGHTLHRQASRVVECESGWNPDAVSPGGGNHGLFQINGVHRRAFTEVTGRPWGDVYEPFWNAVYARWLWDRQGWAPWSCRP